MFLEKSDVCTNNKDINSALGVKSLTSFPSRHIKCGFAFSRYRNEKISLKEVLG